MNKATTVTTETQHIVIPKDTAESYLTDSLTGILSDKVDYKQLLEEELVEKYEITD